jgi:hypothetical protein
MDGEERAAGRRRANESEPAGNAPRASGKDGAQLQRGYGGRITREEEVFFLSRLAATNNFTAAAAEAGRTPEAFHKRRRNDPAFDRECIDARARGHDRVEQLLLDHAEATLSGRAPLPPDSPIPPMSIDQAINLLKLTRGTVRGEGRRAGWQARIRSLDEVRGSILRKLSAFDRARRRKGQGGPEGAPQPDGEA